VALAHAHNPGFAEGRLDQALEVYLAGGMT
jgi:hypothetical protein